MLQETVGGRPVRYETRIHSVNHPEKSAKALIVRSTEEESLRLIILIFIKREILYCPKSNYKVHRRV